MSFKLYEYPAKNIKIKVCMQEFFDSMYAIEETELYIKIRNKDTNVICARIYSNSTVEINSLEWMGVFDKRVGIIVYEKSFVKVYSDFVVSAYEKSTIHAYGEIECTVSDSTTVNAYDNSIIWAYDTSIITAHTNSKITAYQNVSIECYGQTEVKLYNDSKAISYNQSTIYAYDDSSVVAQLFTTVFAYNNSSIKAEGKSIVEANNFSTIYKNSDKAVIIKNNHFGLVLGQVFTVEEDMVVYKKLGDNRIAELLLTKGQIFQSELHNKCRTEKAIVLKIESVDGKTSFNEGRSKFDSDFIYTVGETVYPKKPYCEAIGQCASGIHFFLTRREAERF